MTLVVDMHPVDHAKHIVAVETVAIIQMITLGLVSKPTLKDTEISWQITIDDLKNLRIKTRNRGTNSKRKVIKIGRK